MAPKWFNEWKMGVAGDVENFTLPAFNKYWKLISKFKKRLNVMQTFRGIGHFTQMIQDQGTKVGCAMASFSTFRGVVPYKGYLVCCNYDRSNMRNFPVYKFGKPASGCKTGRDPDYPALCSKSEEIDPNLSFHWRLKLAEIFYKLRTLISKLHIHIYKFKYYLSNQSQLYISRGLCLNKHQMTHEIKSYRLLKLFVSFLVFILSMNLFT